MRKKDLFEQNTVLYNRLQSAVAELEKYKKLYDENIEEINSLRKQLADIEIKEAEKLEQPVTEEPSIEEKSEEEEVANVELEGIAEYGARVIGKIIIEGTKISNDFSLNPNQYSKDLINLVLGKTEVAKAEIYSVVSSQNEISEKEKAIDEVFANCKEYFLSLVNQV